VNPNGKLRILFFVNSSVRAGVEEVVLSLVKGLDRGRFEVHLAAPEALLSSFAADLNNCAVKTIPVAFDSLWQWSEMRRLVRYLRRERIQILNSHLFKSTLFAAPLARLAGTPVVVETTHGPEVWRRSWWKRQCWVDQLVERFVTKNIAVSQANRQYLISQKRYPAWKIEVVPNGRDVSTYSTVPEEELRSLRGRLGLRQEDRIITLVGRLEEQKGHSYLLTALPAVVSRFPYVRVILVGDGSLRGRLEKQAADLGLERYVLFVGHQASVAPYYRLAEFVMLPSLYEGMPLAAIEAGAAGRAIIASDVDGTTEVVVPGETGLLVPPRSPEALGAAICSLLADPAAARAMGLAARGRVEREFSVERQIDVSAQAYWNCRVS